jgi:hypothetical protein
MKFATQVVQDGFFSSFITMPRYLAIPQKLVEDTPVRCAEVLRVCHAFRAHIVLCFGRVNEVTGDVQVASEYDVLAHLSEVADPRVECCQEAVTKVISQTIAVGRAIDTKEYESRELDDEAASLCIEDCRIDSKARDLAGRGVAADACVFVELTVGC